jgi:hypothetical protein
MNSKTLAASAILLSAIPASAGSTVPSLTNAEPVASSESGWRVRTAIYGWGTSLNGDVTLRGNNVPVDVGFSDILQKIDFAFMGAVEVGNGKWSFLADLFYAELSANNTKRGILFDCQLNQFVGNFIVAYNVIDTAPTRFDVYAGARVNSMDTELNIDFPILPDISDSARKTWVDPIIGVRFQRELSDKFFFRALGDIGGFGIESDLTWQAMAAIGYRVNNNGSVVLGYRGIGTDYSSGGFGYDVISHGLLLGFEYKF